MKLHLTVLFIFLVVVKLWSQEVVNVDFSKTYQKIDGFGASSAWHGQLTDKEASVSFGNATGQLGLSILRLRIDPGGANAWGDEMVNTKKALAYGVNVFATPWTPPASMKTNDSLGSGELKPTEYGNFVKYLNTYIDYMAKNKAPISSISLQNEPNIKVTYESCDWSENQMLDFCKNYAQNIKAPVIVPEAFNFARSYSNLLLNDSLAASHISIIGGHLYGATPTYDPLALAKGKKVWMTEHYIDGDDITACLTMATEISNCMSANMNAYVWWWLRQPSCNLITSGATSILKKGYTMAHFSKFIRPGYYRAAISYNKYTGLTACAFTGAKQVIVAINRSPNAKKVQFNLTGDSIRYLLKYTTTGTKNLKQEGTVEVLNHTATIDVEPQSVTTLVSNDVAVIPLSVNEMGLPDKINLYPNPTESGNFKLNIDRLQEKFPLDLKIISIDGKVVFEQKVQSNDTEIESRLSPGVYIINLSGKESISTQKLIVK